ncbi:MAG: hypothetical protein WC254_04895 [Candidatus Woesearchaeota archaeon]|jgi:hypothetical protein
MEQYFLIWALVLIIGTIVFYVIMKNLLKTLATFLFIILLFVVITGTLTYSDFNNLKTKLEKMETGYVLEENNEPIFGAIVTEQTQTELDITKEYKEIIKDNELYKLIAINSIVYNDLPEEIGTKSKKTLIETVKDTSASFEERAQAFNILNSAVKEQGIGYLFIEYKEENIKVYPKTMFFRTISIIPTTWLEKFTSSNEE